MGMMEIHLQMAFEVWVALSDGTRAAPMGTTQLGGMMGPRCQVTPARIKASRVIRASSEQGWSGFSRPFGHTS